jgi:lipid II:glycine glycyltransferase (peptidoglycan interpeptide bridge formation enzyme)
LSWYPYNAFIWESIKDACEGGCSSFDFGRTSYTDAGLFQFKKRWGTVEEKLYYSYFPGDVAERVIDRTGALLSILKKCVSRAPLPLYKELSERVFAFLG